MKTWRFRTRPKHPMEPQFGWLTMDQAWEAANLVRGNGNTVAIKAWFTTYYDDPVIGDLQARVLLGDPERTLADKKGVRYGFLEVVVADLPSERAVSIACARLKRLSKELLKLSYVTLARSVKAEAGAVLVICGPVNKQQAEWAPQVQAAVLRHAAKHKLIIANAPIEQAKGRVW